MFTYRFTVLYSKKIILIHGKSEYRKGNRDVCLVDFELDSLFKHGSIEQSMSELYWDGPGSRQPSLEL